jgi:hypothetical protein
MNPITLKLFGVIVFAAVLKSTFYKVLLTTQMYSNIRNISGAAFTLGKRALLVCAQAGLTACKSMTTFS